MKITAFSMLEGKVFIIFNRSDASERRYIVETIPENGFDIFISHSRSGSFVFNDLVYLKKYKFSICEIDQYDKPIGNLMISNEVTVY
jgi:reverse gyrase